MAGGAGLPGGVGLGGLGLLGGTFATPLLPSVFGEIGLKTSDVSREASWNGSESCKGESAKGSSMLEKSITLVTGFWKGSVPFESTDIGEKMSGLSLEAWLKISAGNWFSLLKMSYVLLEGESWVVEL